MTSSVGRIEHLQVRRLVRPAEDGEGPELRGEPGVEHVRVLLELAPSRSVAQAVGSSSRHGDVPVVAVPRGDAMPPPELARDAPVVDVAHPLEVGLRPDLRDEADRAVLDGAGCAGSASGCDLHEPLRREVAARRRSCSAGSGRARGGAPRSRRGGPRSPAARARPCAPRSGRGRRSAPASAVIFAVGPMTSICGQVVPLAGWRSRSRRAPA